MARAYNRAYLASVLRTFCQILLRRTSDTFGTLNAIEEKAEIKTLQLVSNWKKDLY